MIRSLKELRDAVRSHRERPRAQVYQSAPAPHNRLDHNMSFAAVITGSEMWADNLAQFVAACHCSCAEPGDVNPDDIFPRLYTWEATWGGIAQLEEIWRWSGTGGGPGTGFNLSETKIYRRALLAVNTQGCGDVTCSCDNNSCPQCDPRCQLGCMKVPTGTPVIMNIGTWPVIGDANSGPIFPDLGIILIKHPAVFFSYYMDQVSCVCDWPSSPDICPS